MVKVSGKTKFKTSRQVSGKRTCLLVLGMHRSGTSALTRVLSLMGADLPKNLMGSSADNEKGHWEPQRLVDYHDQLLEELDSSWHDWRPLDFTKLTTARRETIQSDILEIVNSECPDSELFVIKDPRVCRFAGFFIDALQQDGIGVKPVLSFRNPLEVSRSLEERTNNWFDKYTRTDAALLWLSHILCAERETRAHKRAIVGYDEVLSDWKGEVKSIQKQFGMEFPHSFRETEKEINEFLDARLRHHTRSDEEVLLDPHLRGWAGDAYSAVNKLRSAKGTRNAKETLDHIQSVILSAKPVLNAVLEEAHLANRSLVERQADVEQLQKEVSGKKAIERNLTELQCELEKAIAQQKALEAGFGGLIDAKDQALVDAQADVEQLKKEVSAKKSNERKLSKLQVEHKNVVAQQKALEAEFKGQIDAKDRALVDAQADVKQLQKEVSGKKAIERQLTELQCEHEKGIARQKALEAEFEGQIDAKDRALELAWGKLETTHQAYRNSTSWKITKPFRILKDIGRLIVLCGPNLFELINRGDGLNSSVAKAMEVWRSNGFVGLNSAVKAILLRQRLVGKKDDGQPNASNFSSYIIPYRQEVLGSKWHISYRANSKTKSEGNTNITVSAVTYNSKKWLEIFFKSLEKQSFPTENINLIIVDNGSSDGTNKFLIDYKEKNSKRYNSVKLLKLKNQGFGSGHDMAIRKSRDEFVLVTNVDLEFHKESIQGIVNHGIADDLNVASWELRQCPYEHPKYYDPVTLDTSWSSHACVLLRKSAYLRVGGYETKIFMYGEDVELSYRLRGNGFGLKYIPWVTVTHHVDLEDQAVRPHQLSGSIAANLLIRSRYGTSEEREEGQAIIEGLLSTEQDANRLNSFQIAYSKFQEDKEHFVNSNRPTSMVPFPFAGLDYDMCRDGYNVPLSRDAGKGAIPKVSIITRTHGQNLYYLREAITSVLNQTYENIEHIIVEDGT